MASEALFTALSTDDYVVTKEDVPKIVKTIQESEYAYTPKPYAQLDGYGKHFLDTIDAMIESTQASSYSIDGLRFALVHYAHYYPADPKTLRIAQAWIKWVRILARQQLNADAQ